MVGDPNCLIVRLALGCNQDILTNRHLEVTDRYLLAERPVGWRPDLWPTKLYMASRVAGQLSIALVYSPTLRQQLVQ